MSRLKSHILQRGRVSLLATFMLLIAMVIAAPGVSSARAAVKQYLSEISPSAVSGNTTGTSFTVTITDCGGTPLRTPCTASSTIQLGSAQILVPTRFSNVTFGTASSPNGRNWTGFWDGTYIQAWAVTGNDKLNAGESVSLTFTADASNCQTGSFEFTTTAWGSTPTHMGETFTPLAQPSVGVNGCSLESGESVTDPTTGQTETVGGDFQGHVNVTFGGNLACNQDPQWEAGYHLPIQVNITPGEGFIAGAGPKFSTSTFDPAVQPPGLPAGAGDSSFYRICYSTNPDAATGTILQPCYPGGGAAAIPPPCVDKQYREFDTGKIVITILMPGEDPGKH
jgi:hypothetical protein